MFLSVTYINMCDLKFKFKNIYLVKHLLLVRRATDIIHEVAEVNKIINVGRNYKILNFSLILKSKHIFAHLHLIAMTVKLIFQLDLSCNIF